MTGRYLNELKQLSAVYEAALSADIGSLANTVQTWAERPMIMVGSGGSFSTASFAAFLHEHATGRLTRAATPLELITGNLPDAGVACFSANGRNRDIMTAFRNASLREVNPLSALVLADESPLADLASRWHYSNVIAAPHPVFEDGFLAVASLLASCVLLTRAYRALSDADGQMPETLHELMSSTSSVTHLDELGSLLEPLATRQYVSVLFTPALAPAAVDLESRYVEAALGALHIADFRNFGHGRHVWMAKRSQQTAVLALVGDKLQPLAGKTLDLLPNDIKITRVDFRGTWDLQGLAGLVVSLHAAESAGHTAGIDPGKPGVPSFGRALYRLAPQSDGKRQRELNRDAAITRKRQPIDNPKWIAHYDDQFEKLNGERFGGLVADYDGTLCDNIARFDPLREDVASELTRLCASGAAIGIATGRGPSAGVALRVALPTAWHAQVLVGYYNGAEVRPLADTTDPLLPELKRDHLMLKALAVDSVLGEARVQTCNIAQVSLSLNSDVDVERAVARAYHLLRSVGIKGNVVASSHSIDILLRGQSKADVVRAVLRGSDQDKPVLRLGDRGKWPGNDAQLLDDPYGLGVDVVSPHPHHCWALSPPGVKGVQATLFFLKRLTWTKVGGRLRLSPGARA